MTDISRRTPLSDLPEFLKVEEAAAWLGISRGLAYALARRGELPAVRFGRLLRVRRDGLVGNLNEEGRINEIEADETGARSDIKNTFDSSHAKHPSEG